MLSNFAMFICSFKKPLETQLTPCKRGILLAPSNNRRAESNPYEEPIGQITASGHV